MCRVTYNIILMIYETRFRINKYRIKKLLNVNIYLNKLYKLIIVCFSHVISTYLYVPRIGNLGVGVFERVAQTSSLKDLASLRATVSKLAETVGTLRPTRRTRPPRRPIWQ